jgi:CRP-like cAMP-binding protein
MHRLASFSFPKMDVPVTVPTHAGVHSGNFFLATLPDEAYADIAARLVPHRLKRDEQIHGHGEAITFVNFPVNALVSIVSTLSNGGMCEVATVGREGFAEVDVALGSRISSRTAFCQTPGTVLRLPVDDFERLWAHPAVATLVRRVVRARLIVTEQLATCNVRHTVIERCAKWLLLTRFHLGLDVLSMTHDFLALMLGVRRAGVTTAAAALQAAGAIEYRRGSIRLMSLERLAELACECPAVCIGAYERSLSGDDSVSGT